MKMRRKSLLINHQIVDASYDLSGYTQQVGLDLGQQISGQVVILDGKDEIRAEAADTFSKKS